MLSRHLIRFAAPRTVSALPALALFVRPPAGLRCSRVFISTESSIADEGEDKKKKVKLPIDVYDNDKEWWEQITSPHDFMPKVGTAGFTVGCKGLVFSVVWAYRTNADRRGISRIQDRDTLPGAMIVAMIMYNECEESEEEAENERLRQARLAAKDKQRSPAAAQ